MSPETYRIWDVHCHLAGVAGRTPHERMARLLGFADRVGIERVTVYMGMSFLADPTPEQLREQNDQVLEAISHYHDRAFGFVYLNPKHVDFSLAELDRCVGQGPMVGVKLWIAERAHRAALDPLVERASELNALIFQHTWLKSPLVGGNLPGESTPMELAELAARHPKARFICGHTGGQWELGIRAVRSLPNVWLDLGGFDPTSGVTEMAVREVGCERILFGSDAGGRSFASQLAKVLGADIPEQAKVQILGGNLRMLLGHA